MATDGMLALPAPRSRTPQLAVSADRDLLAATTCGRVVHIATVSAKLVQSWRLPAHILLLAFHEEDALLVMTSDGSAWRLPANDESLHKKRSREAAAGRRPAQTVGEAQRLPLPPLGPLSSARFVPGGVFVWSTAGGAVQHTMLPAVVGGAVGPPTSCPGLDALRACTSAPAILPVHRGSSNGQRSGRGKASSTLTPRLFRAMHGSGAADDALIIASADESGSVYCATLKELVGGDDDNGDHAEDIAESSVPAAASQILAAVGEPATAVLAAGGGDGAPADTIVLLGQRGGMLVLTGNSDGSITRRLWRLPACSILGGCILGRQLIILTTSGAYAHQLPPAMSAPSSAVNQPKDAAADSAAAAAADAAIRRATIASTSFGWSLDETSGSSASALAVPEPLLVPLALAPLPLAAVALAKDGAAPTSPQLCTVDARGALRTLRLPASPLAAAPSGSSTAAAASGCGDAGGVGGTVSEEDECFLSAYTERCLRERLRCIGESAAQLKHEEVLLARAHARLNERVAAHAALRAMARADGGGAGARGQGPGACRVRMSDDGMSAIFEVHNPTDKPLGDGWSLLAMASRELPLGLPPGSGGGDEAMLAGEADSAAASESLCVSLRALPAGGRWQIPWALPPHAWHAPLLLHVFVTFCAAPRTVRLAAAVHHGPAHVDDKDEAEATTSVCTMVRVDELLLHHRLRHRQRWPASEDASEVGALRRLRELAVGATGVGESDPPSTVVGGGAGSRGGDVAAAMTHCKLRMRPYVDITTVAGGAGADGNSHAAAPSAAGCLRLLLADSAGANAGSLASAAGAAGGGRQASASFELPDGVGCSLRTSTDADAGTLLLMQCDEPASLWALRASVLRALTRAPPRLPPRATAALAPAAAAEKAAGNTDAGAQGKGGHAAALTMEAATLLPQLRKWQLAHVQLHEQVQRCFELRRSFDRGSTSVNLAELSLEVAQQCKRTLELHQAIRGQAGCPALAMLS